MVYFRAYVSEGSFAVGIAATQGNALSARKWGHNLITIYPSCAVIENLGVMGSLSVVGIRTSRLRPVLGHLWAVC